MTIDVGKYAYSTYEGWDENPYKLLTYLLNNNEVIWRLLKYTTPDGWDNSNSKYPDLSYDEKVAMIYTGFGEMVDYQVFTDVGETDSFTKEQSILRISNLSLSPYTRTTGNADFIFEVYCHYHLQQLTNRRTRSDMIIQQLIKTFNGKDVGVGIGKLFFDKTNVSNKDTVLAAGQLPFKGKYLIMSNNVGG